MKYSKSAATLEAIMALCKRRGFVYPSADIYGGLNGVYDFGPLGSLMQQNLRELWIRSLHAAHDDILLMEGALLGPKKMWEASGHIENFNDPMVDCLNCKCRYRADEIDLEKPCITCGKKMWTDVRLFNMMFKTELGATSTQTSSAYLRPETAQAIFVNFKNVMATNRVSIPFGIAQMGKAFRNEINPKQFLFRVREFEQMELEWFCKESQAPQAFDFWIQKRIDFYKHIGMDMDNIRVRAHEKSELSHYSRGTSDIEYQFPFGWKEIEGIAYRGDFDLSQHSKMSGKDLRVYDEETKTSFTPHIVECSVGLGRLFLTILFDAYDEDVADEETRIVLRLHPRVAPIKAAILPLTKKQTEQASKIFKDLKKNNYSLFFDESGSIGKRYRRYDEIGTPFCITYDFESDQDHCVTIRDRDTMKQERINIDLLNDYLQKILK